MSRIVLVALKNDELRIRVMMQDYLEEQTARIGLLSLKQGTNKNPSIVPAPRLLGLSAVRSVRITQQREIFCRFLPLKYNTLSIDRISKLAHQAKEAIM